MPNSQARRSIHQASQQRDIEVQATGSSIDMSTSPGGFTPRSSVGTTPTAAGAALASQWQSIEPVDSSVQDEAARDIPSNNDTIQVLPGISIDSVDELGRDGFQEALAPASVPEQVSDPLIEQLDPGFVQPHMEQAVLVGQQRVGVPPSEDWDYSDEPFSPGFFDEGFPSASGQEGQSSEPAEGFEQPSGAIHSTADEGGPSELTAALEDVAMTT
ncbi:hypothetical protein HK405_015841, partial [Cladochytrium tenue]